MNLLQIIVKIFIQIGRPVLWLIKRLISILKKISTLKVPKIRLKIPEFNWNKLKLRKKIQLKIKTPKLKWPKILLKKNLNQRIDLKKLERKKRKWFLKKRVWLLAGSGLVVGLVSVWFYVEIVKDLPNVNLIYSPPNLSTQILDKNGKVLYKFYENENRTWIPIEKIPTDLIEATLAIEDKNFYNHHGLSLKGLVQAVIYNFKKDKTDKPRGGSTISQQLVKNIFFTNEKTMTRKIKEAVLTLVVENKMSKNEILERYLNQVSYGGEAYGVEEAAEKYFGKHVWDLETQESAYLAGLP